MLETKISVEEVGYPNTSESFIYGEKEIEPIQLSDLVTLSQVRSGINPEIRKLKESIQKNGLINQPDIARLDRQSFVEYVDFVNSVWRTRHNPDDYPPAADGMTYLVVAGHTRVESLRMIEDERWTAHEIESPYDEFYPMLVHCKIHDGLTPESIIALQLNENIHKQPPKERQAMAIVETYFYGLNNGKWSNQAEFLRYNGEHFGRHALSDALNFTRLPSEIRDFVFAGGIPYRAGVELGKTYPLYCEYAAKKYFDGQIPEYMQVEKASEFQNGVYEWLMAEVAHLQNAKGQKKLSTAVINSRYESFRDNFQDEIRRQGGEEPQTSFAMADTLADWRIIRRRERDRHRALMLEISNGQLGKAAHLIDLHMELRLKTGGLEAEEEVQEIAAAVERQYVRAIGSRALS